MTPGRYNMVCPQGSTFSQELTYSVDDVAVDLTGYSARMKVKEKYTSSIAELDLTTENGAITLGGEEGTILIEVSAEETAALIAKEYIYDLEIVTGENVTRLIEGKFIVTPEVTR